MKVDAHVMLIHLRVNYPLQSWILVVFHIHGWMLFSNSITWYLRRWCKWSAYCASLGPWASLEHSERAPLDCWNGNQKARGILTMKLAYSSVPHYSGKLRSPLQKIVLAIVYNLPTYVLSTLVCPPPAPPRPPQLKGKYSQAAVMSSWVMIDSLPNGSFGTKLLRVFAVQIFSTMHRINAKGNILSFAYNYWWWTIWASACWEDGRAMCGSSIHGYRWI